MIFQRALRRELTQSALATFVVLLAITLTTQLIRFLGQAAGGSLAVEGVPAMLGFTALGSLSVLLSLTVFIAVLMTLTRSYRDSEMIVWFSSGMSLTAWVRPVLAFVAPLVLTIAVLSLVLSPWAARMVEELRAQLDSRDEVARVSPGVFRESRQNERVYFVEHGETDERVVSNIFVRSLQHQREGVMVARSGYQETAENGDRFLVLLDGRRYEGTPGSAEYRISRFERYAMRIEAYEAKRELPSAKSTDTLGLLALGTPQAMGELAWRLGQPLSALLLSVLAIPLAFVSPRGGRWLNLVFALLVYVTYSNCMSVAQAWIAQGRVEAAAGMAGVHGAMLLIALALFLRRITVFSLLRLVR